VREVVAALQAAADPQAAEVLTRYFQVRPGGYGFGDVFLGIKVGRLRAIGKPYYGAEFMAEDWLELLTSPIHEHRLLCLIVMSERSRRLGGSGETHPKEFAHIFETYLANTASINNWDLVDVSSAPVVGGYLMNRDRAVLYRLARSSTLWERRIAMVSTQRFIGAGQTADVYRLAELLLHDPNDLMHKAVGWMLREAGKRVDVTELCRFLDEHASSMPRTTLRYAIERLKPEERRHYLQVRRS
jgi:3-methyladenine DNA glycosylase AlkD